MYPFCVSCICFVFGVAVCLLFCLFLATVRGICGCCCFSQHLFMYPFCVSCICFVFGVAVCLLFCLFLATVRGFCGIFATFPVILRFSSSFLLWLVDTFL